MYCTVDTLNPCSNTIQHHPTGKGVWCILLVVWEYIVACKKYIKICFVRMRARLAVWKRAWQTQNVRNWSKFDVLAVAWCAFQSFSRSSKEWDAATRMNTREISHQWLQKFIVMDMIEGSLEVKLPTVWRDGNAEVGRVREEKRRKRRSEKRKSQKKEDAGAWKGRKVAAHPVSSMICGPGGSKSRLAKAAGAEPSGQMRDGKMHAVVARSIFPSQNVQSTPGSDHFWEVEMSKKCTPLWREAHLEVKSKRNTSFGALFWSWDVEIVHAVVPRSTFPSQKGQKLTGTEHFWTFRCRFVWQAQGIVHLVKCEQNVKVL